MAKPKQPILEGVHLHAAHHGLEHDHPHRPGHEHGLCQMVVQVRTNRKEACGEATCCRGEKFCQEHGGDHGHA